MSMNSWSILRLAAVMSFTRVCISTVGVSASFPPGPFSENVARMASEVRSWTLRLASPPDLDVDELTDDRRCRKAWWPLTEWLMMCGAKFHALNSVENPICSP